MQRGRGSEGLLAAGYVIILKNEDVAIGQRVDAIIDPLAVARNRCRAVTGRCNAIRSFSPSHKKTLASGYLWISGQR